MPTLTGRLLDEGLRKGIQRVLFANSLEEIFSPEPH